MKILFTHRNFPAQFIHLAAYLGKDPAHQVVFLTEREEGQMPGVAKVLYKPHRLPSPATSPASSSKPQTAATLR